MVNFATDCGFWFTTSIVGFEVNPVKFDSYSANNFAKFILVKLAEILVKLFVLEIFNCVVPCSTDNLGFLDVSNEVAIPLVSPYVTP